MVTSEIGASPRTRAVLAALWATPLLLLTVACSNAKTSQVKSADAGAPQPARSAPSAAAPANGEGAVSGTVSTASRFC